jgi:hypothetical protein
MTKQVKQKSMNAELIHIECGLFNGIVNYRLGDKILRFGLGTPKFNDYGEFRVSTDFELIDFNDKYVGHIPPGVDPIISLTDEQSHWWLTIDTLDSLTDFMTEGQVAGGRTSDGVFVVIDADNNIIPFTEWSELDHDPYEYFMYSVLNVAYTWYGSDDYKKNKPVFDVLTFPNL